MKQPFHYDCCAENSFGQLPRRIHSRSLKPATPHANYKIKFLQFNFTADKTRLIYMNKNSVQKVTHVEQNTAGCILPITTFTH